MVTNSLITVWAVEQCDADAVWDAIKNWGGCGKGLLARVPKPPKVPVSHMFVAYLLLQKGRQWLASLRAEWVGASIVLPTGNVDAAGID
jgi:hypothetical protein